MKPLLGWGLGVCLLIPGLVVAGAAIGDRVRVSRLADGFARLSPDERAERLHQIGYRREYRLLNLVRQAVDQAEHRGELQAAGYAAMRLGDTDSVPRLLARAQAGPDDAVRADLFLYAVKLSARDARLVDPLSRDAAGSEPWCRAGASAGLLQIGRTEGGTQLLQLVREAPPEIRAYAMREFCGVAGPMAQTVGHPFDWVASDPIPINDRSIGELTAFWERYATVGLLNDVLQRLQSRDPDWVEMGRLIHARDRVARYLR